MNFKGKGLGKGLASLLGESNVDDTKKIQQTFNTENVSIHFLKPSRFQPRKNFDKQQLEDLALSIKARGIIQPIVVRKSDENTFEIIAGERRWRGCSVSSATRSANSCIECGRHACRRVCCAREYPERGFECFRRS